MTKLRDLLQVREITDNKYADFIIPNEAISYVHLYAQPSNYNKDFLVWLPESISELTPQQLLSYINLGIVTRNPYTRVSYTLPWFLQFLEAYENNK